MRDDHVPFLRPRKCERILSSSRIAAGIGWARALFRSWSARRPNARHEDTDSFKKRTYSPIPPPSLPGLAAGIIVHVITPGL